MQCHQIAPTSGNKFVERYVGLLHWKLINIAQRT